jgi:hypothetical protein
MIDSSMLDQIFENDGSYRDIYVHNSELRDWETIIELLRNNYKCRLLKDGVEINFETYDAARIFRERGNFGFTLSVDFKGVIINSHFFEEDAIEFDIYPKEIGSSLEKRMTVFEFMQFVAISINRSVSITPENSPTLPYLEISPDGEITILV